MRILGADATADSAMIQLTEHPPNAEASLSDLEGGIVANERFYVQCNFAVPELDANANAVAFETIVLQNEGFARDEAVVETPEF